MKINIFIIVLEFSGVKTYIEDLVLYFQKKNNLIIYEIFLNNEYKEFKIIYLKKLNKIYIPENKHSYLNAKYNVRAAQLIKIYFPDLKNIIIHANGPAHLLFAQQLKQIYQCPVLFTCHFLLGFYSYCSKYPRRNIDKLIKKFDGLNFETLKSSDHIICVTEFTRKVLIKHLNVDSDKISVIHNYKKIQNKNKNNVNYLKQKYGFRPEDRIILFVGRLEERKGVDNLITVFERLSSRFDNIRLIIAGSGDYDKYLSIVHKYFGKIHFIGNLPKDILYDFYRISEIGIVPSRFEQCSYVVIEMINFNLPIIASNVPGLTELFTQNKTALLCKMKKSPLISNSLEIDEDSLTDKITFLLNNRSFGIKMANYAMKKLGEYKNMGEDTYCIYKSLISSHIRPK